MTTVDRQTVNDMLFYAGIVEQQLDAGAVNLTPYPGGDYSRLRRLADKLEAATVQAREAAE
ncbi:MAG TPA: hypothetical protein VIK75_10185 [Calditerricola sp.]